MYRIRKLVFLITAVTLAALALPALAHDDDDSFSVVITAGATAGTYTAKITSLEKSNNEKIRSFKISAPSGGTISSTALSGTGSFGGATRVPAAIPPATPDVTFKNVTIGYNQYILVTMTAALPGATSCGSTNLKWKAYAWENSNASGDQFDLDNSKSNLTTSVTNTCALEFVSTAQPANAITSAIITNSPFNNPAGTSVQVRLVVNGATAPSTFDRSVSLSSICATDALALTGASTTSVSGFASFGLLKSSTKGAGCTLTATATGFGTAPSASFNVVDATLKFTAVPTSIAPNGASQPVTVTLVDAGNATIPAASPAVNLSVQSGTCTLGPTGLPTTTGVTTFSGLVFGGTAGTCALKADGTFDGVPFSATSASFPVFVAADLACNPTPPSGPPVSTDPGYFDNLPTGVTTVTDVGYAAGYRTANDKFNPCNVLNYTFTNNIKGSGPTLDNAGNTLPVNAVSMVWDSSYEPNAVFTYTLTFLPESVGADGLPSKHTKFCKLSATPPTDCTLAANQQNMQACIGTALSSASIPGSDPACIAEESWTVVDPALCGNSLVTGPACVRVINRVIDARDPPINRG